MRAGCFWETAPHEPPSSPRPLLPVFPDWHQEEREKSTRVSVPRASLADSLYPGLSYFAPSGLGGSSMETLLSPSPPLVPRGGRGAGIARAFGSLALRRSKFRRASGR